MICYRGTDRDEKPVPCECEEFGWPRKTKDGDTMYENSHFLTEKEAWEHLFDSRDAGIFLAAQQVEEAERQLRKAQERAAREIVRAAHINENYKDWKREQGEKDE